MTVLCCDWFWFSLSTPHFFMIPKGAPVGSVTRWPLRERKKSERCSRPFVAGEPGCRRPALVSWVLFDGSLAGSGSVTTVDGPYGEDKKTESYIPQFLSCALDP